MLREKKTGSIKNRDKLPGGVAKPAKAIPPNAAIVYVPAIEGQRRSSSIRDKSGRTLPTSPLAAGILRQQSVATPTGNLVHRTVIPHVTSMSASGASASDARASSSHSDGTHSSDSDSGRHPSAFAIGAKSKPRLTRQIAIHDEIVSGQPSPSAYKTVSFNTSNLAPLPSTSKSERNYCPLHSPRVLQGVWESSIEEDFEEENESPVKVASRDTDKSGETKKSSDNIFTAVASIYTNRDKNRLGLSGFIPRKLSTISSRSCSVNPDNDAGDVVVEESPNVPSEAPIGRPTASPSSDSNKQQHFTPVSPSREVLKSSNELLNVIAFSTTNNAARGVERQLSKSDHDLYHKCQASKSSPKSIGSIVRLTVTPDTSAPEAAPGASRGRSASSIEIVETVCFDDNTHKPNTKLLAGSPDFRGREEKQSDNDDDSSEMDRLMQ